MKKKKEKRKKKKEKRKKKKEKRKNSQKINQKTINIIFISDP
jgi:hypothetical protein